MAKCRIGHIARGAHPRGAGVDFIDESEVLTPADEVNHVDKHDFKVPFVCGCRDLGEALRRIGEGAAMIRTKGEAGTGNIVEAVRHMQDGAPRNIKRLTHADRRRAHGRGQGSGRALRAGPQVAETGKLPVPNFSAGGVAIPADAALMMQLGAEAVFVGSGIFEIGKDLPPKEQRKAQLQVASAMVKTVANWDNPALIAEISTGLPKAMRGISLETLPEEQLLAKRGW